MGVFGISPILCVDDHLTAASGEIIVMSKSAQISFAKIN